jgi:uncharacterized membrane protein
MRAWTDERMEQIISALLRTGVLSSAAVVFLGGVCFLARRGNEAADYHVFHAVQPSLRSVPGVLGAVGPSDCLAVIQLGLLLLIATPVARVAFSLVGFALARDRAYAGLTAAVLAILIYGLWGRQ